MQNLEQIRAKNALEAAKNKFKGKNEGDVVKKVPTMILENGLLASLAFAIEDEEKQKKKNQESGYANVFYACIEHLYNIGNIDEKFSTKEFLSYLTSKKCNSAQLRSTTTEVMAYLNYLRRFAS